MSQKQLIPLLFRAKLDQLKSQLIHKLNYLCADLSLLNLNGKAQAENDQSLTSGLGILILGRGTYHEKHEWFSIASSDELRKVLKLRDQQTKSFHYIGPLLNGKRPVLTITPYADVIQFCQRAVLVLPVTVLIAHSLPSGLSNVQAYDTSFFLLKHADGWSSALPSPVLNSAANALLLLGGHPDSDLFTYSRPEFYALLQNSLTKVKLAEWRAGWIGFSSAQPSFPWGVTLGGSAALVLVYFFVSTFYLSLMNSNRQQKIDEIGPELTELLATKRQFDQNQQLVNLLESRLSERPDTIKIWTLMAVMQMKDYKVLKIQWIDERLNLTVESRSATDALQFIMDQHFVDSAEFTAPVRRNQSEQEVFSAKVKFNNENLTKAGVEEGKKRLWLAMTKQHYLLLLLALLAGARFVVVPLYERQDEMLQTLQLTSQQLEKAERLVANRLSLEQGMAQLKLNLTELTALFPAATTASQFRLSAQQQLQQQFASQNIQVTVFDWVSQSDISAGSIEVHTARLILQGSAPQLMKAYTDYFSVLPYAKVTELTIESRMVSALSEEAATLPVSAVVVVEFSRLGSLPE